MNVHDASSQGGKKVMADNHSLVALPFANAKDPLESILHPQESIWPTFAMTRASISILVTN
jgi:hypothetical protein